MKASNDGTFWMIDRDFFKYFNGLQISGPILPNWIIRQFIYHFTPGSHDGQPFNSPAAKIAERSNYALQITGSIQPNKPVNIRILIEKRNSVGPNIQSSYMILLGKSNGKKLTPDIVRYTFRYSLTHNLFSFSYPIERKDQIITIAMHRLSKCNIAEFCYVQIMCDVDYKLYNIDTPSQLIPKSENYEIIFQKAKKSVNDEVKPIIIPPKIIKNDINEITENEKEIDNFKLLKIRADKSDVDAMFECSEMLQYGDGVERDMKEALKYCKMAIDKGSAKAMYRYALNYELGEGVTINKKEALKYYKMAGDKGIVKAMVKSAEMMSNGDGVAINKKEAAKYYKIAANKGECLSMYNLAVMLSNGDGIPENKAEAAKYYKMAADKNDIDAMYRYADYDIVKFIIKYKNKIIAFEKDTPIDEFTELEKVLKIFKCLILRFENPKTRFSTAFITLERAINCLNELEHVHSVPFGKILSQSLSKYTLEAIDGGIWGLGYSFTPEGRKDFIKRLINQKNPTEESYLHYFDINDYQEYSDNVELPKIDLSPEEEVFMTEEGDPVESNDDTEQVAEDSEVGQVSDDSIEDNEEDESILTEGNAKLNDTKHVTAAKLALQEILETRNYKNRSLTNIHIRVYNSYLEPGEDKYENYINTTLQYSWVQIRSEEDNMYQIGDIAMRLLSAVLSEASCERAISRQRSIHTNRRMRSKSDLLDARHILQASK